VTQTQLLTAPIEQQTLSATTICALYLASIQDIGFAFVPLASSAPTPATSWGTNYTLVTSADYPGWLGYSR
jgi:hypothetical protein